MKIINKKKIIMFSSLVMLLFLIGCSKINPFNKKQDEGIEKAVIHIEFFDQDGIMQIFDIREDQKLIFPTPTDYECYRFIEWEETKIDDLTIHYYAKYELVQFDYTLTYETYDIDLSYHSKDEMVKAFLNDFYDFIQPEESLILFLYGLNWQNEQLIKNGTWSQYLGGSQGVRNKLIKENDLKLVDENYFFNSSYYGLKWKHLGEYVRNNICKSNRRFGYADVEYKFGALDFYRYIIGEDGGYLKSYGGEEVFYGFPECEIELVKDYHYEEIINLPFVYNPSFKGWYYDNRFFDGPYKQCNGIGNKKVYAKWQEETEYAIELYDYNDNNDLVMVDVLTSPINESIQLPTMEKDDATFMGWYLNGTKMNDEISVIIPVTISLEARWNYNDVNDLIPLTYENKTVYYNDSYKPIEIYENYCEKEEKSEELRAVWVSSFIKGFSPSSDEFTIKQELTKVLDEIEALNFNAIFFHLRTHNNAFYKTNLAPIKQEYGTYETFESFDYVPWLIEECHKRGIEFHAWLNPYRITLDKLSADVTAEDEALKYKDYPLNPASKKENILITYVNETERGSILNPAKQEVRNYLVAVIQEIIQNYEVDGIHFDDYFYAKLNNTAATLDDSDQEDFIEYCNQSITPIDVNSEAAKQNWRRENINLLIESIHNLITNYNNMNKKNIQFGISPTSVYKSGNGSIDDGANVSYGGHYGASLFCDTYYWVKQEWIDYIIPQTYSGFVTGGRNNFADCAEWWNRALEGSKVNLYLGIGVHNMGNLDKNSWAYDEELFNQLKYIQTLKNVKGVSLFSSTAIANSLKDTNSTKYLIYKKLKEEYWTKKMVVPKSRLNN